MKNLLLRLSILTLPGVLIYLGVIYGDSFYFIISAISIILSVLVVFPKLLSEYELRFPKLKWKKPDLRQIQKNSVKNKLLPKKFGFIGKLFTISTLIFTTLFSIITILFLGNGASNKNLFFSYAIDIYNFVLKEKNVSIILFVATSILIFLAFSKRKPVKKLFPRFAMSLIITSGTILSGIVLGLLVAFIVAVVQLNISVLSSIINIRNTGVVTDQQKMIDKLKSMDKAPPIIPYTSGEKNRLLVMLLNVKADYRSFYYVRVVSFIPQFLTIPLKVPNSSVFMMGDMLVVKGINPSEIEPLSPYIGHLIVKTYFGSRFVKSYPTVKVMGRQEYLDYRISQYNKIIDKLNSAIQSLAKEISGYYGRIQSDKNNIAGWQQDIVTANSYKQTDYNNCVSAGYYDYFTGSFYYYYSPSYCQQKASNDYDGYINQANQNIASLSQDISLVGGYITQDQNAENELKGYAASIQAAKSSTPQELGVFEPPTDIKVAVDETSPTAIVDFFEALSHEYLHYASYVNADQVLKYSFFEEGLTETFARKAARKEFNVNTHIGYPVLVAIISEMMKKIPESTFEDLYFSKNESELEGAIAKAYGDKFYKDFSNYFDIISYLPVKDALSLSNAMLLRMGSQPIKEIDLYSSPDTSN